MGKLRRYACVVAALLVAGIAIQCQQTAQDHSQPYELSDEEMERRSARLHRESDALDRMAARELRLAAITDIKARCQRQMGSQGASLVKYCTDQDIAAYDALQGYPRKHKSTLDRCEQAMMATGGWSLVKYCADEDIAAAKALERY